MLLLLLACSGANDSSKTGEDTGWVEATDTTSAGGSYYMMYSADPDPVPFNETFQLIAMVHNGADHAEMYTDADLVVDATMPAHGHGMNTAPTVTRDENGMYTVDGMLFHMRGWWKIDFTASRNGVTETGSFYVDCCDD